MNEPPPPAVETTWTRARLGGWVAAIFVIQIVLIVVLSTRSPALVASVGRPPRVTFLTQPVPATSGPAEESGGDPAEAALVSARGFSGPVWRQLPLLEPGLVLRTDPPRWLTNDLVLSAAGLVATARSCVVPLPGVAPQPASFGDPPPGATVPPAGSQVRLEGDLAQRRRLTLPPLPAWPHQDVLAPTAVQMLVDGEGNVLSTTLLSRSGHAAADQRALELARATRFEPASAAPALTWGRMVFQWQVVTPGTNAP